MNDKSLTETIEGISDAFSLFQKSHGEKMSAFDDRLAAIESGIDRPHGGNANRPRHKLGRVLKALADPRAKLDGYEGEWSAEFAQKSQIDLPGAFWVPLSSKAVDYDSESPTSGGSNLVPTELRDSEFIDILRQRSTVLQAGARVLNATGNLDIPKETTGATAYWISGDGSSITESESVFTSVQMRPKFCAAWVKYTYRTGLQTGGDVERIIRADLAAQIAAEIDNQAINGAGTSNKPNGILNQSSNAHTYTSSPQAVQWSDVVELEKLLIEDKVPMVRPAYIAGVTCYKLLKTVSRAGTEAIFLADFTGNRPTLNGYPLLVSTHVPANQLILGDFSELLVATWGAVALMADPYSDFSSGTVGVRAIAPIDIAVRHGVSFAVAS